MRMKQLNMSEMATHGDTQQRVAINMDMVEEYAENMRCGAKFPPVTVFHDGVQYWLADGFHRYHAHRAAGITEIMAEVHEGVKQRAKLSRLGVETASNSFHLSMSLSSV